MTLTSPKKLRGSPRLHGCQLIQGKDEILVRVIPKRGDLARRLLGAGKNLAPERYAVAELVNERELEG